MKQDDQHDITRDSLLPNPHVKLQKTGHQFLIPSHPVSLSIGQRRVHPRLKRVRTPEFFSWHMQGVNHFGVST